MPDTLWSLDEKALERNLNRPEHASGWNQDAERAGVCRLFRLRIAGGGPDVMARKTRAAVDERVAHSVI
ncbi:hypothetical protein D3260_15765 [Salinisphaera sp. Q1T1-3]|nr:hypothetical protein D3260_15765 [Salinisphaera sp. Q1T1-3]